MASWADIKYFLEVHRAGSLSAAARVLGVDQTTVGRRLKALERDLGAKLLRATARGVSLTPAGHAILGDAEAIEATVASLHRKVGGADERIEGVVSIATTEALASTFLIPQLPALRASHPSLDFVILGGNEPVDLAAGDADLALRLVPPDQPELIARRVGEIRLGVFASENYLAQHDEPSFDDGLAGHEVLSYSGELAGGSEARWLAAHASSARVVLRVTTVLNLAAATTAGLGIAVLPAGLGTGLRELTVPDPPESRGAWIVFHRDHRDSARVKAVVEFLAGSRRLL